MNQKERDRLKVLHETKEGHLTQKQAADLTEKESGLAQMLANEQGRWSDFNTRLDDIERELASRAR